MAVELRCYIPTNDVAIIGLKVIFKRFNIKGIYVIVNMGFETWYKMASLIQGGLGF